ncbi:MAG: 30S ribosomal protein S20 [Acidobacteriota bacterium]|nr:30S ribosomal protein S20 [Acidobacteriota bacterium]
MANSKQAEKRIRQNEKRRMHNRSYRSRMRTQIKRLRAAVAENDAETAQKLLPETLKVIDSTAQKNVIHRNTAARYKSRLSKAVQALAS